MVREPVNLSDWINFLDRKVDRANAISIASVASLIALITLFIVVWSFQGSIYSTEVTLVTLATSTNTSIDIKNISEVIISLNSLKYTILVVIVFQIAVSMYVPNSPRIVKAKKLLDEIMLNEGETDVSEIRRKWKEECVTVENKYSIIQFWGLLIFGFVLLLFGINQSDRAIMVSIVSIAVSIIGLDFALDSGIISKRALRIAQESKERMDSIGSTEIQDSILNLLQIRSKFFEDVQKYFTDYQGFNDFRSSENYRGDNLRSVFEWATWYQYVALSKAMKMKKYLSEPDKIDILRSHDIIISNVMNEQMIKFSQPIVMNRNVNQLLNGCRLLREELPDLRANNQDYEVIFENSFHNYLLIRIPGEDFLIWIQRNKQLITNENERFHSLR
jgi:hypothetical protein